jgi:hypothetical protein
LGIGWAVILIGSWIASGVIPDLRLAMIAGAVLLVVAALSIREILKLGVMDNRHKALIIGGLVFMMLAPFARLMMHFVFEVDMRWAQ